MNPPRKARRVASAFKKVWLGPVQKLYQQGRINSERALQAIIVGELAQMLPEHVVLVEPEVRGKAVYRPDLFVCSSKRGTKGPGSIVAIIELKYVPQGYAKWMGDFDKLTHLLTERNLRVADVNPLNGSPGQWYEFSLESIGIYAVVAKYDSHAVCPDILRREAVRRARKQGRERAASLGRIQHAFGSVPHNSGRDPIFRVRALTLR